MTMRAPFRSLPRLIKRVARDMRGNVMMIMGFALIPMTFATGMVIDYSRAARLQTKLNAAADAAALSGITKPLLDQSKEAACNAARRTFLNAIEQKSSGLTFNAASNNLQISVAETYGLDNPANLNCGTALLSVPQTFSKPASRIVTVTYSGGSKNAFAGVLGKPTLAIGGTSTARAAPDAYIDIHLALDTSQSMGLAATDKDASDLFKKTTEINGTGNGCAFGCHVFQAKGALEGKNTAKVSNEQIATDAGIKLRIDVLRQASADMIQTAKDMQGDKSLYQFGLYRIGDTSSVISKLSTNLTTAKSTVQGLKLGPNDENGRGDTNLNDMLHFTADKVRGNGDGLSQDKAREFIFIVTDGVIDLYRMSSYTINNTTYNCRIAKWDHCTAPIDANTCNKIKDKKVVIGVVYTTYLPVKLDPTDSAKPDLREEYTNLVQPFSNDIASQLKACSSDPSKWYFEASDGASIHAAMQKLFRQAAENQKLTN